MAVQIPLDNSGPTIFSVDLNGVGVTFKTYYNGTAKCWAFDMYDSVGTVLLTGIMLVPFVDLFAPYPEIKAALGSLYMLDYSPEAYKTEELFGIESILVSFAPDEVA